MAAYDEGVDLADRTVSSSESEDEEERQDRGEEAHIKQGELRISHRPGRPGHAGLPCICL